MKKNFLTTKTGAYSSAMPSRRIIDLTGQQEPTAAEMLRVARVNRARSGFLTGRTLAGLPLAEETVKYYDSLMSGLADGATQADRAQLLVRAHSNDKQVALDARRTLASLRIEVFSNYFYANALWLNQYAEVINLKDDERPVAQRITRQEVTISAVGGDGMPRSVKINLDTDETLVPLGWLSTDIVRYRKVDIMRGRVVDPALATINLATDFGVKVDGKVQDLLIGSGANFFGAFTFTGKRANWSYVAHSRVNTANLPSTNDVQVYDQDGTT